MAPRVKQALRDIEQACKKIEEAWECASHDYFEFPDIVLEHTNDLDLSAFDNVAVLQELLLHPEIAKLQEPSSFSDLYYTLFDNGKFFVEVLNWWGSDINIHDHDFAGVQFQVRGSSLNVEYAFENATPTDGVDLGTLRVSKAELWPEGSRYRVFPGQPHNVSHLSEPTVSILIRTHPDAKFGVQRNYFAPNVAAVYPVHDVLWRKRTKMLRLLSTSPDVGNFEHAFAAVTQAQTPCENLFTLVKMADKVFGGDLVHLVQHFAERDFLSSQIAQAAAYYRANEVLAKGLKYAASESPLETLCMSALSSSVDRKSFDRIHNELQASDPDVDLWTAIGAMSERLQGADANSLESLVSLFDLKVARAP